MQFPRPDPEHPLPCYLYLLYNSFFLLFFLIFTSLYLIIRLTTSAKQSNYLSYANSSPFLPYLLDSLAKYFFRISIPNSRSATSIATCNISLSFLTLYSSLFSFLICSAGVTLFFIRFLFCQFNLPCFLNQTNTVLLPRILYFRCTCL